MTNPTSNFGWQMPTSTDLVTDLPADFEVFGQAVDTDFVDLLGGTTGQILSKTSNTDLDFTWITNDVGDITAVNVTSPITGGGSSGAVTIGINAATTSVVGAVQLSDSTSTTSSVLASTPTATKAAYDLANTASTTATAAIPKSTVTTAGDVIYATGSGAVTRLGIGTAGQVLKVNSGATAPEWAAASGGGKVLQVVSAITTTATTIATTAMTDTTITATITPTSASSTILVLINGVLTHGINSSGSGVGGQLMRGASVIQGYASAFIDLSGATGATRIDRYARIPIIYMDSPATTSATTYKLQGRINDTANSGTSTWQSGSYGSSIVLMEIGA
jgi:hypothetical protein